MVREYRHQLAVQEAGVAIANQLIEAVRLLGDEHGDALALGGPARQAQLHLHADLLADVPQTVDELVERAVQLGEVDQHGHDEEPLHDLLLDVLDVDVAGREERGDAGHHALLVAADDGHDGAVAPGHTADLTGGRGARPTPTTPPPRPPPPP